MLIIVVNWQYNWFVTNAIQNLNLKNLSTIGNYIVLFVSTLRLSSGLTLGWVYSNMNSKIFAIVHLFRTFESIFARLDVISRNRTISRFSSRRYINKTTGLMKSIESIFEFLKPPVCIRPVSWVTPPVAPVVIHV